MRPGKFAGWHAAAACVVAFLAAATAAWAQFAPEGMTPPSPAQSPARLAAREAYQKNLAAHGEDPDYLVRPGLLANRKDKTVRLWGQATGIATNDPIEFFVIGEGSGKGYEAVIYGFVKPSHVREALEFVGMKPGLPVDFGRDRYWPRGERVIATVIWDQNGQQKRVRAEDLIWDLRRNRPLPHSGFVFTGSYYLEGDGPPRLAGDFNDGRSIISDYNDPSTILDVPRQAAQSAVYGSLKLNPAYQLDREQSVQILLEPEYKDGRSRVRALDLRISVPAGASVQAAQFVLTDSTGNRLNAQDDLIHLLAEFARMREAQLDPYVTVHIDPATTLANVKRIYDVLGELDNEQGIRIEPPPADHLYYGAFFPDDEWRDRENRLGKPWELHIVEKDRQLAGTLILPADEIDDNDGQGDLTFTVGTPQELARILVERSGRFSQAVYIFAPGSVRHGELMSFIAEARRTHRAMWIFLPK